MRKLVFIFLFFIVCTKANAQFIIAGQYTANDYFHDVVPDSSYTAINAMGGSMSTKPIDINGDGVIDFDLVAQMYGGGGNPGGQTYIVPKNANEVISYGNVSCTWTAAATPSAGVTSKEIVSAFDSGDTIKNGLNWRDTTINITYRYWCMLTNFNPTTARFVGVRIFISNDTLYGWIKLRAYNGPAFSTTGFILEEFACNKGTTIGIKEYYNPLSLKLYPNPTRDKVEFVLNNPSSDLEMKIFNSLGQIVFEDKMVNSNKFTLDVSNYANGLYYVEVESKDGISRAKFVKIEHEEDNFNCISNCSGNFL
ncbi:MAG: T9SS type A sorting domain-containing protein [Sphingobacteriaceae bacterium]|nr:T9SS type A sorting domain-containing protein [Sphingobacteriaceae bacterium]